MNEILRQDLTEERWRRLQSLFDAALELPREARKAYLECETASALDPRQELEEMFAHVDGAAERIARTIGNVAQQAAFGRTIREKRDLLLGICPEAANLLRNQRV